MRRAMAVAVPTHYTYALADLLMWPTTCLYISPQADVPAEILCANKVLECLPVNIFFEESTNRYTT